MKIKIKVPCPKCGEKDLHILRTERWDLIAQLTGEPLVGYRLGCCAHKGRRCFRDQNVFFSYNDVLNYLHERRTK